MSSELIFDERIRDWVFLPLLYVMFIMGIIKMSVSKLMSGGGAQPDFKLTDDDKVKENNEKYSPIN